MYAIIQQVDHIKQKVENSIKLYDDCIINKEELNVLLLRYLTQEQIKKLYLRLGI
jgi:hypothetical protein